MIWLLLAAALVGFAVAVITIAAFIWWVLADLPYSCARCGKGRGCICEEL